MNEQLDCCEIVTEIFKDNAEVTKFTVEEEKTFWFSADIGHFSFDNGEPLPIRVLRYLNKYNFTDLEKRLIAIGILQDEYVIKKFETRQDGECFLCLDGVIIKHSTFSPNCECGRYVYDSERLSNLYERL